VPVTNDNCAVATVVNDFTGSNDASGIYPVGTTVVTYTVTDASGNITTCSFIVIVNDNQAPNIICPADILVSTDASSCDAFVTVPPATATDNEGIASITNSINGTIDASGTYPLGVTTITWTAIDNTGNSSTCTMTITVEDNENPTITCPAPVSVNNNSGSCGANGVTLGTPITADNCSVASVVNNAPASFPIGNTTVTWTITDDAGNTATCNQTITVTDNEDPTIACPSDVAVNNDNGVCGAVVTFSITSTDNCAGEIITQTAGLSSGSIFPIGVTTNTFLVTDASGNTATCSFDVTVTDNEDPTVACPSDIAVNNDNGVCGAVVTFNVTSNDNCAGEIITQTAGLSSGSAFPIGVTTNTFLVTDASGNTATCSFNVTVNDNEDPTVACPTDVAVNTDLGTCDATGVNLGTPLTADNCNVASAVNDAPASFPLGNTTVTWTVTDDSGNTTTCTQEVTVTDVEVPTITCPSDQNVPSDVNCQFTMLDYAGLASASDNCDTSVDVTQSPAIGDIVSVRAHSILL
jgi:hypothetical protein